MNADNCIDRNGMISTIAGNKTTKIEMVDGQCVVELEGFVTSKEVVGM